MKLLLDTHALIWSVDDPAKLSVAAAAAVNDPSNDRMMSAATIWELAIKAGMGKITLLPSYWPWMEKAIRVLGLGIIPVTVEYAERQVVLPTHHKDPFDRLMIAQALVDGIPIISNDVIFDAYGVTRIW